MNKRNCNVREFVATPSIALRWPETTVRSLAATDEVPISFGYTMYPCFSGELYGRSGLGLSEGIPELGNFSGPSAGGVGRRRVPEILQNNAIRSHDPLDIYPPPSTTTVRIYTEKW